MQLCWTADTERDWRPDPPPVGECLGRDEGGGDRRRLPVTFGDKHPLQPLRWRHRVHQPGLLGTARARQRTHPPSPPGALNIFKNHLCTSRGSRCTRALLLVPSALSAIAAVNVLNCSRLQRIGVVLQLAAAMPLPVALHGCSLPAMLLAAGSPLRQRISP